MCIAAYTLSFWCIWAWVTGVTAMPVAEDDTAPFRHAGCMQAVYWARLAQAHLRSNTITAAKQVFSRCMLTCLSMDVWMTYLQFIKQVRDHC